MEDYHVISTTKAKKQNIASQEDDGTIIIIAQRHRVNSKFIL